MRQHGSDGMTWSSGFPVLQAGDEVAGFIVEGPLASGAFGVVYRARQGERFFAIKLVPLGPRGDREADALRKVLHTNVVGFHGYGYWPHEEPRFLVLALELVEGRTLDVWALEENPSALELVRQVLLPLVHMLGEVHAAGVVHRDVKESNVLVRDEDGEPVLVDFGAAGYEGAPRLTAVLPPGTPEYRSPEAVRFAREDEGKGPYPAGPGDDLWALGVTLYFILTRELPFGDRLRRDLNRAILQEHPIPPHVRNPRVPPGLGELCLRLLEKVPQARYEDAGQLAGALEEAADQADDTWRVPLFPGERKEKRSAPAPAPEVRELPAAPEPPVTPPAPEPRQPRWWPWAVGLVLAVALLLRESPEESPRAALPFHHAMPRVFSGQELETSSVTGEVGSSAEPLRSPTPAPIAHAMHSEVPPMIKSRKLRSLFAAACAAGSACASAPKVRPPPPPEDCPPGAIEAMKRLGFYGSSHAVVFAPFRPPFKDVPVQQGPVMAKVSGHWGALPDFTMFSGKMFIGTNRVYARFTEARLPSGEVVPMCVEVIEANSRASGVLMSDGGTPERPIIFSVSWVASVHRFGEQ
jgi:serine/threonine-protein kinase